MIASASESQFAVCSPGAPCRLIARRPAAQVSLLRADALCQAYGTPFSARCSPALHTPVCTAMQNAIHLEHFHDHARIEQMLFDGVLVPKNGTLYPDVAAPGLGLELKRADAERYAR